MLEYLGLPEVPYEVYEHSPLALVVCQVRFGSVLSVSDIRFVAPFQEAIRAHYPDTEPWKQAEFQLNRETGEAQVAAESRTFWRFSDAARNWAVVLAPDFLTLETRAYTHIDDLLSRLGVIFRALAEHVHPTLINRFGLRYINEIRPDHQDWGRIIQPQLVGPAAASPVSDHIQQTIQLIQMRFPGNQGMTVQHGIFPSGTTIMDTNPAVRPPSQPFYLLDYDAFLELSPEAGTGVEVASLAARAQDFNQAIYRLFRWSITDEYRESMEVRADDVD